MPYADIEERRRVSRESAARRRARCLPEDQSYRRMVNLQKARKLRRFLAALKLTAGCIDCEYNYHEDALEFDHKDEYKGHPHVSQARSWNWLIEQLDKVDVRCANCHAIRSNEQRRAESFLS